MAISKVAYFDPEYIYSEEYAEMERIDRELGPFLDIGKYSLYKNRPKNFIEVPHSGYVDWLVGLFVEREHHRVVMRSPKSVLRDFNNFIHTKNFLPVSEYALSQSLKRKYGIYPVYIQDGKNKMKRVYK